MRLTKQLFWVILILGILFGVLELFMFDVIKIDWISFMEIQPSYKPMEHPLPVPASSIPVEGPDYIPNGQTLPANPVPATSDSIARGQELFGINCQMCHGVTGVGNGPIAPFLVKYKPANLTSPIVQAFPDGQIFVTITNGVPNRMPPLNENLTVSERWDVVNYVRTLQAAK
jgi:mono/diheme cytochrome c family protein